MKAPPELLQLQRQMAAALMQPLTRQDGLQPQTGVDFIRPSQRLSSRERLEIYARQYWFRLLDCLYDDYPALRLLLGEARFHQLCRRYLACYPSASWTLRNLGSQLPHFISDPRARDVAAVEWAQTLAFDEAWEAPIQIADLQGADPATLHLALQPCVILVSLQYQVDVFITAMKKAESAGRSSASQAVAARPSAEPSSGVRRPPLRRGQVGLVVHRHDNRLYFKRLEPGAFQVLTALQSGKTLGAALASVDTAAAHVARWFQEFAELGWLVAPQQLRRRAKAPQWPDEE